MPKLGGHQIVWRKNKVRSENFIPKIKYFWVSLLRKGLKVLSSLTGIDYTEILNTNLNLSATKISLYQQDNDAKIYCYKRFIEHKEDPIIREATPIAGL